MATFGKTTTGSTTTSSSGNKTVVSPFVATVTGTVATGQVRLAVDTGTATVRIVIYANSAGSPGALLAQSDAITVTNTTAAFLTGTFSGANQVTLTSGTTYYLGASWADPGSNSVVYDRDNTTSQRVEQNTDRPDPFGTPSLISGGPIAVNITNAGGPPGSVFDLSRVKVTLPTDGGDVDTTADEVEQPALAAYADTNFALDATNRMVMRAPVQGATTTGSDATRCEFREVNTSGDYALATVGYRRLTVTGVYDPTSISDRQEMIIGQIHGATGTPPLYLAVEHNVASPRLRVFKDGPGLSNPLTGLTTTTRITYRIEITGGRVRLWCAIGDVVDLPSTPQFDWAASEFTDRTGCYLKAGAYNKSTVADGGTGTAVANISFFELLQTNPNPPNPVVASVGTAVTGSGASAAVPVPSGVAVGDTVAVFLFKQNNAAVTAPAGFTALTPAQAAVDTVHYVWWKVATAADTGTYSFTWTGSTTREAVAVRITGAHPSAPIDSGGGAPNSAIRSSNGTTTPAVSLTTQGADRLLVWSGANFAGGVWTPPSGYTERYDGGARLTLATSARATAGATGSVTGVCAASEFETAWLLAFVPAPTTANITGLDTGVGTETGYAALVLTGDDTATGTDDGYVAIPTAGSDSAGGDDSLGGLAADITGADDPAAGAETGGLAATVDGGTDTATGTETGLIVIPGSDTASGADALTSLDANVVAGDAATGSSGGFIDVLFGDLVVSLFAIDPGTGALVALPDFTKLTIAPARNGPGSISLDYPRDGLNFASLYAWTFGADRDLEVEIWVSGSPAQALRGYLQEGSGNAVDESPNWTFSGGFLELRMAEARVFPQAAGSANSNAKREVVFNAATPGAIMGTLLAQAQARGTLTDIVKGFSNAADSRGAAWPNVVTTKFSPGAGYDQVVAKLVDLGLVEWGITWTGSTRRLDMWAPGNRGLDRTLGARPIVLRAGRNLIDAPRKWSVKNSATAVLAAGAEGVYATAADVNAQARRGRRIETSASASNLSDLGAVQAYSGVQLAAVTPGVLEVDHGLGFLPGEPRPVIAFNLGDWVYSQTTLATAGAAGTYPGAGTFPGGSVFPGTFVPSGPPLERLRVVEWSLTVDASQNPSGTVTLNDSLAETLVKLRDRLDQLSSGDTVIGTSSSGVDTGVPSAPSDVVATSTAFLVGGAVRSSVQVGWTPPTVNTDGSVITDLAGFTIQYGFGLLPTVWEDGATINAGTAVSGSFTTEPGKTIGIRVRAFDNSGNNSAWSTTINHTTAADAQPPAVPSAPVVTNYLGVLTIAWDGRTSTGADMLTASPDFDHVDVHVFTTSGFAPDTSTYFDRMFAAGAVVYTDGAYGTAYFARLVAVDGSGNASAPSGQGSDIPQQVVSLDVFDGAIGTAKLAEAAITTAKINDLAVNNAKIGDLSVGKLTAGIMTASVTLSGIIRTATTGARSEMDGAGIRLYNGSNVNTVNLRATDGSALVTGTFRSALSGERMEINPGAGQADTIAVYPSGGGSFATITARTAPADGSAAILIDGGATSGSGRGRLGAYRSEGFISYVTSDSAGDTQSGFSRTAVSCSVNDVAMWTQNRITFARYSGSSQVSNTGAWLLWANGTDPNCLVLGANTQDAGVKFDNGTTCSTNAIGTLFGPHRATAYNIASSSEAKQDIVDVRQVLTPLDVIARARPRAYRYRDEIEARGDAAPLRIGPLAEDLPPELIDMSPRAGGGGWEPSVDLGRQVGVLWAAVNQLLDQQVRRTTATVIPPALTVANTNVDVTVAWDGGPTQTVPALVSIVPVGPGPLQQRAVTATVTDITVAGATVRFRSKRALTGGSALDPDDRYVVNAIYEYTPPYLPAP